MEVVSIKLKIDVYMGVSKNHGTPKSSILIDFSIIFTIHFVVPLCLETSIWAIYNDLSRGHPK